MRDDRFVSDAELETCLSVLFVSNKRIFYIPQFNDVLQFSIAEMINLDIFLDILKILTYQNPSPGLSELPIGSAVLTIQLSYMHLMLLEVIQTTHLIS